MKGTLVYKRNQRYGLVRIDPANILKKLSQNKETYYSIYMFIA